MSRSPYFVYILTNKVGTVLYIGVTNDLPRRVSEHRDGAGPSFARRYRVTRLIYFEPYSEIRDALLREKQLKGWSRKKKEDLIKRSNPSLRDLSDEAVHQSRT